LSVIGNRLCITIPENWLSEAKYPVIVDPTIGTTTTGSQIKIYNTYMGVEHNLIFAYQIPVNRFLAPETVHGSCTAHAYVHSSRTSTWDRPVMYSDDTGEPMNKMSGDEGVIDFSGTAGQPPGWRSAPFSCGAPVEAGAYCWFGLFAQYWQTAYDYGGTLYAEVFGTTYYDLETIPDLYPQDNLASSLYGTMLSMLSELRLSMYFSYTAAQNYIRTLTQGVTLTDTRKHTADYKRAMTMNTNSVTLLGHRSDYYREHTSGITVTDVTSRCRGFFRSLAEQLHTGDFISCCRDFLRFIATTLRPETTETRTLSARRGIAGQAGAWDSTARQRGFIRTLVTAVTAADYAGKVIALLRGIQEEVSALGEAGHLGDYIRGLYTEAGSMAETTHRAEYHRKQQDTAYSEAVPLRHLFIFIRLITGSYIRDFFIGRFLKYREEIVIKSPVCRELILDSKVH
jgi:hypothetical protein